MVRDVSLNGLSRVTVDTACRGGVGGFALRDRPATGPALTPNATRDHSLRATLDVQAVSCGTIAGSDLRAWLDHGHPHGLIYESVFQKRLVQILCEALGVGPHLVLVENLPIVASTEGRFGTPIRIRRGRHVAIAMPIDGAKRVPVDIALPLTPTANVPPDPAWLRAISGGAS